MLVPVCGSRCAREGASSEAEPARGRWGPSGEAEPARGSVSLERGEPCSRGRLVGPLWWAAGPSRRGLCSVCMFWVMFEECLCFVFFAGFKQDSPGFSGDPCGCPRHQDHQYQPPRRIRKKEEL
jgi:hypothetical protein